MPNDPCLIGSIYDAAINHELWDQVTAQIATYCGGEKVMLATTDTLHPLSNFQYTHNIPDAHVAAWREGYDEQEVELHNRWVSAVDIGTPINSDDHFGGPDAYLEAGGPFVQMLHRNGIRRQLIMMLELDHFRLSGIGLNNWEPFPPYASNHLQSLAPHLRRSLEIHHQITSLNQENQGLYRLLETMSTGVILLDNKRRIRYTTQHAKQMIIEHDGLRVSRGLLRSRDLNQHSHLQALMTNAIQVALREPSEAAGGTVCLPGAAGKSLTLSVVPLSSLASCQELQHDHIAAAIFLSPTGSAIELPLSALAQRYQLTPRELELCHAFANHIDLDKVARQLNLKRSSIRSLLKTIYSKTGQTSQAGLMRLLMESRLNFRHPPPGDAFTIT